MYVKYNYTLEYYNTNESRIREFIFIKLYKQAINNKKTKFLKNKLCNYLVTI